MRIFTDLLFAVVFASLTTLAQGAELPPIFDAHVHYSEEAWALLPPQDAVALLRKAGVKRALVSSTNDNGNQMLHAKAPYLILPLLRTYRKRADIGTWFNDEKVATYLQEGAAQEIPLRGDRRISRL